MSTAVKQFHEEEAIGKTYDFQVARNCCVTCVLTYGYSFLPCC